MARPKSGGGSKRDRVQRLGPDFKSHRFHIPYPTDLDRLTTTQRRYTEEGRGYLKSLGIFRRDEDKRLYDLTERFRMQVSDFPFCQKKDIVDAVSLIYDVDARAPVYYDEVDLEPEWT